MLSKIIANLILTNMKNLLIYYFQILMPVPLLIWAAFKEQSHIFVLLLVMYILYRQYVDGQKLYKAGIIKNIERFSPLLQIKYFKNLYFE